MRKRRKWFLTNKASGLNPEASLVFYVPLDLGTLRTDLTGRHGMGIQGVLLYTGGIFEPLALNRATRFSNLNTDLTTRVWCATSTDFWFSNGTNDLPFTMCFNLRVRNSFNSRRIFSKRGNGLNASVQVQWDIYMFDNKIAIALLDQTTGGYIIAQTTNAVIVDGVDNFFTFTYNGDGTATGLDIYMNDVLQLTDESFDGNYITQRDTASNVGIGNWMDDNTPLSLDGDVSGVGIFNKLLSGEEITFITEVHQGGDFLLQGFGEEMITNGTFDTAAGWTIGTGWSIGGGTANKVPSGNFHSMIQDIGVKVNRTYRIEFEIKNYVAGQIRSAIGAYTAGTFFSGNGVYVETITPTNPSTDAFMYFQANPSFEGSIDNCSVIQVLP